MANVKNLQDEIGEIMVFWMLKSEHPEGEKNVLQMDLKGSDAHSHGQVNQALLLVNIAELINPVWADMFVEAGLICL
ncbi:hypothetical protein [Synechococcus sp. CC9616]|uniref:hypothetical protein n=1 Tax=Synechococcus sp. CC9616 TaxID=110663 RepID=UPI00048A61B1|nr:hypothetical protein [Synechococcus sp. CC9616]